MILFEQLSTSAGLGALFLSLVGINFMALRICSNVNLQIAYTLKKSAVCNVGMFLPAKLTLLSMVPDKDKFNLIEL